jgi:biopolymer transport protein ExbD
MARSFKRKETLAAQSEINVTPLLDLAFSLLIIFMISTPLLEQSIPLELPAVDSQTSSPLEQNFEVVSVDDEGRLYWGEEPVTQAELEIRIRAAANRNPAPAVRLRGDLSVRYQEIVTVLHLLQKHKLTKINFDNTLR